MTGKRGRIIHFITVYQVVDNPTTGPFTVYQQQTASLRLADRNLNPRKAFIHDLIDHLSKLKSSTSEFVIMGNLNEVVGLQQSGFSKVSNEFDLIHIMSYHHSIKNEVVTREGRQGLTTSFVQPT